MAGFLSFPTQPDLRLHSQLAALPVLRPFWAKVIIVKIELPMVPCGAQVEAQGNTEQAAPRGPGPATASIISAPGKPNQGEAHPSLCSAVVSDAFGCIGPCSVQQ